MLGLRPIAAFPIASGGSDSIVVDLFYGGVGHYLEALMEERKAQAMGKVNARAPSRLEQALARISRLEMELK